MLNRFKASNTQMKSYHDPIDKWKHEADFVAEVAPARMHETKSAAFVDRFRESQRERFAKHQSRCFVRQYGPVSK